MSRNYNSMAFTPEEVKDGLQLKLVDTLMEFNKYKKDSYYDIHITTDGYCIIIEWSEVFYEHIGEGQFQFVDGDEEVLRRVYFPDNSSVLVYDDEDEKEHFEEWKKNHPEWKKDFRGDWYESFDKEEE